MEINSIIDKHWRSWAGIVYLFICLCDFFVGPLWWNLLMWDSCADVIAKGTRVDGVYTSDPETDKLAKKIDKISIDEVYKKNLSVMDMTAFTLCKENKLPIIVFDINDLENLSKLAKGEKIGTFIDPF